MWPNNKILKQTATMKKLFRFHKGTLSESLATTINVSGLPEIREKIADSIAWADASFFKNIRIQNQAHSDPRLPPEWNEVSYYVIADFDGHAGQCIGMCNFYEK